MVIVMVAFAGVVGGTDLLSRVDTCSCWCRPSLGNVVPYAHARDTVSYHMQLQISHPPPSLCQGNTGFQKRHAQVDDFVCFCDWNTLSGRLYCSGGGVQAYD